MKWLIASDIHGSARWCEALLGLWDREGADRLLLLGDILYHGPRNDLPEGYAPKEVIALLSARAERIFSVRGNCEAEVDQMVLPFPVMADYALMPVKERLMFVTHGHVWHRGHLPPMRPGDILLHGHTHLPECADLGESRLLFNPGSAALPKNGSWHGCMTLEGSLFRWLDLDGREHIRHEI